MDKLIEHPDSVPRSPVEQTNSPGSSLHTQSHKSLSLFPRAALAVFLGLLGPLSSSLAQDLHLEGRIAAESVKRGNYDQAIVTYSNLVKRNPQDASVRYDRGVIYLMKGDFGNAIADVTRAIDMDPTKVARYSTLAIAYAAEGSRSKSTADCDKAIAMSNKALQRDPRLVDAYGARGWAYVCKAETTKTFTPCDTAITAFTTLIRAKPRDGRAYIGRGRAYLDKGRYDEAIVDANQAIRLSPHSERAYNDRGISYTSKGDQNKAIADFTRAIELANSSVSAKERAIPYYNRGYSLNIKEKYGAAITDFTKAILLDPTNAPFYENRAIAYFHTRNYKAEIADLNQRLRRDPASAYSYNSVAWFLATCPRADLRDGKRAVQHATKACEMTKWKNGDFIDTLAAAYAETGQFEQAVNKEKQALELPDMKTKRDEAKGRVQLYRSGAAYREERRDAPKPGPIIPAVST